MLDLTDAEKDRQQKKTVIGFIWFVSLNLNQTNEMNQINKTNQFEHPAALTLMRTVLFCEISSVDWV
jgi:hypothetical protein